MAFTNFPIKSGAYRKYCYGQKVPWYVPPDENTAVNPVHRFYCTPLEKPASCNRINMALNPFVSGLDIDEGEGIFLYYDLSNSLITTINFNYKRLKDAPKFPLPRS